MQKSESIAALIGALSKAQGAFPGIPKNKTANIKSEKGSYSYAYAGLADIIAAVQPHLTAHGLSISQHPEQLERGIIVTTLLGHESGEWLESTYAVPGATLTAQNVGSIITYARRYALAAILGVAPDEDVDGQTAPEPLSVKKLTQPPRAATLTGEQASRLATTLADLGVSGPQQFGHASRVLERPVGNLSELTAPESKRVFEAARNNKYPAHPLAEAVLYPEDL